MPWARHLRESHMSCLSETCKSKFITTHIGPLVPKSSVLSTGTIQLNMDSGMTSFRLWERELREREKEREREREHMHTHTHTTYTHEWWGWGEGRERISSRLTTECRTLCGA